MASNVVWLDKDTENEEMHIDYSTSTPVKEPRDEEKNQV